MIFWAKIGQKTYGFFLPKYSQKCVFFTRDNIPKKTVAFIGYKTENHEFLTPKKWAQFLFCTQNNPNTKILKIRLYS